VRAAAAWIAARGKLQAVVQFTGSQVETEIKVCLADQAGMLLLKSFCVLNIEC
jgi:hypothetical protein